MGEFFERYLRGEYEQVWADMLALGAAVRQESIIVDALAVARETMRRAHSNIETLIPRLRHLGYTFGYDQIRTWVPPDDQDRVGREPPIFMPPPSTTAAHLHELEQLAGVIPLSLRAWYEHIGAVNFVGMLPPSWKDAEGERREEEWYKMHPPATELPQWDVPREGYTRESGYTVRIDEPELSLPPRSPLSYLTADPLYITTIRKIIDGIYGLKRLNIKVDRLDLCPDNYFKYYFSGGGAYSIEIPNANADADFWWEPGQKLTFVEYLRLCFQWGGLPDLALFDNGNTPACIPPNDIAYLREGLLPI